MVATVFHSVFRSLTLIFVPTLKETRGVANAASMAESPAIAQMSPGIRPVYIKMTKKTAAGISEET